MNWYSAVAAVIVFIALAFLGWQFEQSKMMKVADLTIQLESAKLQAADAEERLARLDSIFSSLLRNNAERADELQKYADSLSVKDEKVRNPLLDERVPDALLDGLRSCESGAECDTVPQAAGDAGKAR